jgi:uncharacterized protein YfiM (DUF2279 family)
MNIILLSFSLQSLSPPDRWFGADKVQHFFMGAFVQGASFGIMRAANAEKGVAFAAATAVSVGVATAKELRDRKAGGILSLKDGIWTVAGAAAISPALARTK